MTEENEFKEPNKEEWKELEKQGYVEKEFNLSEKMMGGFYDKSYIPTKDVKEFIRRLKKEFKYDTHWQRICYEIDKLAGEKLI